MKKHPEQKFTTKRLLNTISYRDDCLSSSDDTSHGWLHFIWHTKQKRTRYNCILYPWVLTVSVPIEISILWDTKKCARALASWERKRTLASMLLMFSCSFVCVWSTRKSILLHCIYFLPFYWNDEGVCSLLCMKMRFLFMFACRHSSPFSTHQVLMSSTNVCFFRFVCLSLFCNFVLFIVCV